MRTHTAYIALGSNLGDRRAHIEAAVSALRRREEIRVIRVSELVETEPVGPPGQGPYLNGAAELSTTRSPEELMRTLLRIEREVGRDRATETERNMPRVIDLDLLLYADRVLDSEGLTLPHPRMHERGFVLTPLASIAPEARHPVLHKSVVELLASLVRKV